MEHWLPITYRDFYDFPRIFLARDGARLLLFDCPFDDGRDEYADVFHVYLMRDPLGADLSETWENLGKHAERRLGEIPASALEFDPTRRREIGASILSRLGG